MLLHVMFRGLCECMYLDYCISCASSFVLLPSQVERFVSEEVEPALTQYESVLNTTAELKI